MSKLSFRARALDASKPMPIYLAEELPDLPEYSAINRAVPQMPSGMEKEEECEHHLQRAICTGLIIPTPEVFTVSDLDFYERCYPPDYKMPKQHIHMQPLWQEQETPEYDIDSEDDRWLKQQRHPELTELKFEQMMDKLEKSSGQTVVTLKEAKLLLERQDDLVIAVYDYWLNKRLKTQHPLILAVKTENRPGQSTNNPYLAFRRRTEKMQTRKNRKNDESSYEKMLKLRRDLARALTLLEMVARRERAKRDLVRLTALLADKRYTAGDFANQLMPDPPPRPQLSAAALAASFRREAYPAPHYPPRAPPTPVDQPRQREKRPYKRRKHKHHVPGSAHGLRDSGVYTSSEEEAGGARAEAATPPDDGPFAFRRKPGCYYEMPTSTLCGDPVDPDSPTEDGVLFEHEIDERYRYTLTSVRTPHPRCVGFARRRLARGGRAALDRRATPLDDLWPALPYAHEHRARTVRQEEMELETKAHRTPKVVTRDYHTSGKHPWRHAFRQHLARNPRLWVPDTPDAPDIKPEPMDAAVSERAASDISASGSGSASARTMDGAVRQNLRTVIGKRAWSSCSEDSYESDDSLLPVEEEFQRFFTEVDKKWLHFRPESPPPQRRSPPEPPADDALPLAADTPLAVELRAAEPPPPGAPHTFTTSEFTLAQLYPSAPSPDHDPDMSGDDLLNENFTGLTEAQVESILSDTDLKALADVDLTRDDKKSLSVDLLDELVKDSFLLQGQSSDGRAGSGKRRRRADAFGCTAVHVSSVDREEIYIERPPQAPPACNNETPKDVKVKDKDKEKERERESKANSLPAPVPTSKVIVEEVSDLLEHPPVKTERRRREDTLEEVQLAHGVQLKTVHAKNSPLKKHIITASHRKGGEVALVTSHDSQQPPPPPPQPQIVTVAVSDSLKMRLQNHQSGHASTVVVQAAHNGPSPTAHSAHSAHTAPLVALSTSAHSSVSSRDSGVSLTSGVVQSRGNMVPLQLRPLLHSHAPVLVTPGVQVAPGVQVTPGVQGPRLKVVHAAPLTQGQRAHLLAHSRAAGITQLPAVVSLATLGDSKGGGAALLKAPNVPQYFEIKGGQLGKGAHLVNVIRQPGPGKGAVARLDLNDPKRRQVMAALEGAALRGGGVGVGVGGGVGAGATRAHKVSVSLDGRQLVRAALPAVRPAHVRHQIHLAKNRTLQVAPHQFRSVSEASTSISLSQAKTASIPSTLVASFLQRSAAGVLPKGPPKVAVQGAAGAASGGGALPTNVQAIAFTGAQIKARQTRLVAQPRAPAQPEIAEASTAPANAAPPPGSPDGAAGGGGGGEGGASNGAVRRRAAPADTLPMEVT